jgi:predicted  nucleic acid-binding Zn-ribbon protein
MQPGQYTEQLRLCQKIMKFHRKKARESRRDVRHIKSDIQWFGMHIRNVRRRMKSAKDLKGYLKIKKELPPLWKDLETTRQELRESRQELTKHEEHISRMGKKLYEFVLNWEGTCT